MRRYVPAPGLSSLPWGGEEPSVVLYKGYTPNLDFYCTTRWPKARYIDTGDVRPGDVPLERGERIFIMRHATRDWVMRLTATPPESVTFFMDDDLPGIMRDPHLPSWYAWRTYHRFVRIVGPLRRLSTRWVVSCTPLAKAYGLPEENILPPLYVESGDPEVSQEPGVVLFYHGTTSHLREMCWLRDVLERVQAALPNAVFEAAGDHRVRDIFKGVPRVRVINHMQWTDFLSYTNAAHYDIGLAPLLPSGFNDMRTHVKFYDITRCGAVGVYADAPIFKRIVQHGRNGMLAPMDDVEAWVERILNLAADSTLRHSLHDKALADARAYGR